MRKHSTRNWLIAVSAWMLGFVMVLCPGLVCPAYAESLEPEAVPTLLETPEGLLVRTKYADIYYPEEFAEAVMVVLAETEDSTMVTVTTILAEKEVMLYTLILTGMELDGMEDFVFGYLQDEILGTISIVLQMEEQIPAEWSEDEFTRICELQETVNDLFEQLQEDPRFVPDVGAA